MRWEQNGARRGRSSMDSSAFRGLILFLVLLALAFASPAHAAGKVEVFLIPHSHCDPGWLETYEGYHNHYVEKILTEVMNSLGRNPRRRFVWAEISYFSRWFDTKSLAIRQQVKQFVESGQLEFVEGGWVQPDEANTNFDILVNQMTEGHDYLLKHFGVRPRVAWQIDPFGHSSMTPTLASAMGFDALVINRIHHNLKAYFKQTRHMEFVWQGSPTLGEQSEIFTHVLHTHYSAPQGFDFEDVGGISASSVPDRARRLADELKSRSTAYRTKNLLVTFGDDFKFQRAEHQFSNMDMLIDEINQGNYGVHIRYATVSEYFDAVFAANVDFPFYKGDFFPYADNSDSYWTGYYTTRPKLKGLTRFATSILHSAETAYALARAQAHTKHLSTFWDDHYSKILQGRRDTALVQHHDGITGTAKPHVADDYTQRLNRAVSASCKILADMVKHLLYNQDNLQSTMLEDVNFRVYEEKDHVFTLTSYTDEIPLVYHNSLGWTRYQYVQAAVSSNNPERIRVFDAEGNAVPFQSSGNPRAGGSKFNIHFMAEVPALGVTTYFVRLVQDSSAPEAPRAHKTTSYTQGSLSGSLSIENEFLKVQLNPQTGLPKSLWDKVSGSKISLDQTYAEYTTSRSGAYIFRPTGLVEFKQPPSVTITEGELMSEIVTTFTPTRQLTMRLYSAPHEPLSYPEIGGVLFTSHNVDAGDNREVVVRYSTDLSTDNHFYTDNGLEMQLRSRDGNKKRSRAHIEDSKAGAKETQYYPSISIAMLRDIALDIQFTVISSQALGTSSHSSGGLEIMLHRNLAQDDGRGLGEGVRDRDVITVKQWLMLGKLEEAEIHRRRLSLQQDHPLTALSLSNQPQGFVWADHFVNAYVPMAEPFPFNVHLLSLKARDAVSSEVILRLVNIAEGREAVAAPSTALPRDFQSEVTVQLDQLFDTNAQWTIEHPRPRSLTLNYDADEVQNRVRYDSSLGLLSMKIDFGKLGRGGAQNTDEEGVFLSQAAIDQMERDKKISGRKPLSIDPPSGERNDAEIKILNDEESYQRDVSQRGHKRRIFDPNSISVAYAKRKLLIAGKDSDPLTMVLRPLEMKSLLLWLHKGHGESSGYTLDDTKEEPQEPQDTERDREENRTEKEALLRQQQLEEQQQKAEAEKMETERRKQVEESIRPKKPNQEEEAQPRTGKQVYGGRRAEASFPGMPRSEVDVLAAEQRFLSTGLEGERMMMMFLTIIVISLMVVAYLAFHRRQAAAIISVSSLASAAYPLMGSNTPTGRDFYRREMDQRLYSKMV